jgi:hypothetical protein
MFHYNFTKIGFPVLNFWDLRRLPWHRRFKAETVIEDV